VLRKQGLREFFISYPILQYSTTPRIKLVSDNVKGDFEYTFLGERCCKNRVDSIKILSFNGLKRSLLLICANQPNLRIGICVQKL
jgi:hypothetical protein